MKTEILVNGKIQVAWDGRRGTCSGCKATIGWGITEKGKRMPFDFDDQHTSHWSSCTEAKRFRGRQ